MATSTSSACIVQRRRGERDRTGWPRDDGVVRGLGRGLPLSARLSAELSSGGHLGRDGGITHESLDRSGQRTEPTDRRTAPCARAVGTSRRYSSSLPRIPQSLAQSPAPSAVIPVLAGVARLSIVETWVGTASKPLVA